MQTSHRGKLFLMMVLEFFIWGAWLPLIYGYLPTLGFSPAQQSWILNAFPLAAIAGMFFGNQFADRISRRKNFSRSAISSADWPSSDSPSREVSGRFSV
jgi:MFS family permease